MNIETCCICDKKLIDYGNNPDPLHLNGRCCNDCNNQVIIARLQLSTQNLYIKIGKCKRLKVS